MHTYYPLPLVPLSLTITIFLSEALKKNSSESAKKPYGQIYHYLPKRGIFVDKCSCVSNVSIHYQHIHSLPLK